MIFKAFSKLDFIENEKRFRFLKKVSTGFFVLQTSGFFEDWIFLQKRVKNLENQIDHKENNTLSQVQSATQLCLD